MCTDLHTFVQNLPTADPIAVNKTDFIYARVINTDKLWFVIQLKISLNTKLIIKYIKLRVRASQLHTLGSNSSYKDTNASN